MRRQHNKIETEKLLAIVCITMAACVLVLTAITIWFSNNGVKPEEKAVLASVELKNYVFVLPDDTINPRIIISSSDKKIDISEFRELEEQVKNAILRTYTDSIVWDATFTYKQKDGTEETRTYTKTESNKAVDAFLKKYYEDFDKDVNME